MRHTVDRKKQLNCFCAVCETLWFHMPSFAVIYLDSGMTSHCGPVGLTYGHLPQFSISCVPLHCLIDLLPAFSMICSRSLCYDCNIDSADEYRC